MGAGVGAVSSAVGERGARAGARGREKAVAAPPGGSGRYRPAIARIGGEKAVVVGRERGEAMAGWGDSGARGRRQRLADMASSDSSTSASR